MRLSYDEFYKICVDWNTVSSDGYAEILAESYASGLMFDREATEFPFRETEDLDHIRCQMISKKMGGPFAWVDAKGRIFDVGMSQHDWTAEMFFGPVPETEKRCARISIHTKDIDSPFKYVETRYRTRKMLESVTLFMYERRDRFYPFMNGII